MPSPSKLLDVPVLDLSAGLISDQQPLNIPPGAAVACSNMVWLNGFMIPRPGLATYGTAPDSNPVTHISMFTDLSGNQTLMRVSANSTTLNVHGSTDQGSTWTLIGTVVNGVNVNYPPTSANFKGLWFLTTGVDLYQWDGTTFQTVAAASGAFPPPYQPRLVISTESRFFIGNCWSGSSAVSPSSDIAYQASWCDQANPNVWSIGNYIGTGTASFVILPSDSTPITGMFPAPNSTVVIFKAREMYLGTLVGPPLVFQFSLLYRNCGCISHRTIKEWRNGYVVWLGDDNIYMAVPGQLPQPLGNTIRPRLRQIGDVANFQKSVASIDRDNDLYTLVVPLIGSSKVCKTFTVNLRNGGWWEGEYQIGAANVLTSFEFQGPNWQQIQLLGLDNGQIGQISFATQGSDFGTPWITSWTSGCIIPKGYHPGQFTGPEQGQVQQLRVFAQSGQVTLGTIIGDGLDRSNIVNWGVQAFNGSGFLYTSFAASQTTGERFQVNFQHVTIAGNQAAPIAAYQLKFIPLNDTRSN